MNTKTKIGIWPPDGETTDFYCLNYPVYGTLLWKP